MTAQELEAVLEKIGRSELWQQAVGSARLNGYMFLGLGLVLLTLGLLGWRQMKDDVLGGRVSLVMGVFLSFICFGAGAQFLLYPQAFAFKWLISN